MPPGGSDMGSPVPRLDANEFTLRLQRTLTAQRVDYKRVIDEFGQVRASEERARGREFGLRDHIRGLVLSLLSNQRPWKPIADNLDRISSIFLDFDPAKIKDADPRQFTRQLRALRCGNRQID